MGVRLPADARLVALLQPGRPARPNSRSPVSPLKWSVPALHRTGEGGHSARERNGDSDLQELSRSLTPSRIALATGDSRLSGPFRSSPPETAIGG
jgi:hypothetical protein